MLNSSLRLLVTPLNLSELQLPHLLDSVNIDLVYEFDRKKLNMSVKVLCPLSAISMIIILLFFNVGEKKGLILVEFLLYALFT